MTYDIFKCFDFFLDWIVSRILRAFYEYTENTLRFFAFFLQEIQTMKHWKWFHRRNQFRKSSKLLNNEASFQKFEIIQVCLWTEPILQQSELFEVNYLIYGFLKKFISFRRLDQIQKNSSFPNKLFELRKFEVSQFISYNESVWEEVKDFKQAISAVKICSFQVVF